MTEKVYTSTELYQAAFAGNMETLTTALHQGLDANELYKDFSPIYAATQNNKLEAVKLLLEFGANPNRNGNGSPLYASVSTRNPELVRVLISGGAIVDLGVGTFTPLYLACQLGYPEMVTVFCESGADVNKSNGEIYQLTTPLYTAVTGGFLEITKTLVKFGADVNLGVGGYENTPLFMAASKNYYDVAVFLLESGANPHRKCGPSKSLPSDVASEPLKSYLLNYKTTHSQSSADMALYK